MRVLAAAAVMGFALGKIEMPDGAVSPWSPFIPFKVGGSCNCGWVTPAACNTPDGSPCWTECCKPPAPSPDCNCDWVKTPGACNHDDGSKCWTECCKGPTPTPPGPTPGPGPAPSPSPIPGDSKPVNLVDESDNANVGNGFSKTGGMRFHSQEKLNLLGGSLTFTVDISRVNNLVNANLYLVIPGTLMGGSHFYCDNSETFVNRGNACIELDIFESNGHSLAASTMHTHVGTNSGCDTWGCRQMVTFGGVIDGNRPFDVEVRVGNDGNLTVQFHQDGKSTWAFNNAGGFDGAAKAAIVDGMRNHGAIVMSSMWTGWVPPNTSGNGDLNGSSYIMSNLAYKGVSMGPTPYPSAEP